MRRAPAARAAQARGRARLGRCARRRRGAWRTALRRCWSRRRGRRARAACRAARPAAPSRAAPAAMQLRRLERRAVRAREAPLCPSTATPTRRAAARCGSPPAAPAPARVSVTSAVCAASGAHLNKVCRGREHRNVVAAHRQRATHAAQRVQQGRRRGVHAARSGGAGEHAHLSASQAGPACASRVSPDAALLCALRGLWRPRLLSEVRCCAFLRRCCKQGVQEDTIRAHPVSVARRAAAQLASVLGT